MRIEIKNAQTSDGEEDIIEETAECKLHFKNGKIYIMYTSAENVSVMIIISDKEITVKRSGETKNTMTFERNAKTLSWYNTPYGRFEIEIFTEKIVNALTENGGKLRIIYTMTMQGQRIYNDMKISIKE